MVLFVSILTVYCDIISIWYGFILNILFIFALKLIIIFILIIDSGKLPLFFKKSYSDGKNTPIQPQSRTYTATTTFSVLLHSLYSAKPPPTPSPWGGWLWQPGYAIVLLVMGGNLVWLLVFLMGNMAVEMYSYPRMGFWGNT